MTPSSTRSFHRIALPILAVLVALSLAFLAGCSETNQEADAQAKNRAYMSSVNEIMDTFSTQMDGFSDAVKDGEVLSLTAQLSAVNDCVDDLKALEVPDALKDVNDSYVKGAEEMQKALSLYVQLYEDVKLPDGGNFDYATYGDRLSEIQNHYAEGVKALEEGDTKASEA